MKKIRTVLLEPSEITSAGMKAILDSTNEFDLVAIVSTLEGKDTWVKDFDLLIMNPSVCGINVADKFRSYLGDNIKIVLLAHNSYNDRMVEGFDAVISIYDSKAKIIKTLRNVINERQEKDDAKLSTREKEIISAVAKGLTNKEIADRFSISINTVMTHRRNISSKLGINSISGLTVYAVINKLIDLE